MCRTVLLTAVLSKWNKSTTESTVHVNVNVHVHDYMNVNVQRKRPLNGIRGWLAYALAWLPPALLYAMAVGLQKDALWWQALISSAVIVGAAALGGVVVWWLSAWLPFPGRWRFAFVIVHLLAAATYAALHLGVLIGWLSIVATGQVARFVLQQAGVWQFITGVYVYGLIAGVSYLIRTQKELRERETAAARAEAAAAEAQLQSVRANLNPHFLFNALHAVGSLLRTDPEAADRAIEHLGGLLRRSLDHSAREAVPLGQEWDFVKSYLELEQLRLGERLHVECDLEASALDVPVPPFLLQPLVENAVRHGVAARAQGGTIRVQARRRNGTLALRIADDGPGAAPVRNTQGTGFGLEGVRRQIARYGPRANVQVESSDHGFAVTLTLPIEPVPL
jgi:two-component system, LytTR family, sensor kinase